MGQPTENLLYQSDGNEDMMDLYWPLAEGFRRPAKVQVVLGSWPEPYHGRTHGVQPIRACKSSYSEHGLQKD